MTITRISRLRDCGIFRDFTWPTDLADFARYNLIYGWNGSGKTTLSRLFRDLELRRPPGMGHATIRIDADEVKGEDFPRVTLPVRVFNRDFVNESVFPVGGGDVPPIFVVGKESVEKQKEADRLKALRTTADSAFASARSSQGDAERTLESFCIDRAKVIKNTLRSPGSHPYNNYDRSDFQGRAQEMATVGDAPAHRLTESDRANFLAQQRAKLEPKVQELAYRLPPLQQLADSVSALLGTTVVSAAIQSLKDDPTLAEWTRRGLGLHKDRQAEKCLFCEQPLPDDRLAALEVHFSAEYEQFLRKLDEQVKQLEVISRQASELKLPNRAELYDHLASEYDAAEQAVRQALQAVREFVDALVGALNEKRGRAFNRLDLDVPVPAVVGGVVDGLNEVIRRHNQACDDFQARVNAARDRLALDMIAGDLDAFVRLRDAVQQAVVAIPLAEREVQRLVAEIARLEREIVEHQQPAEELNEDLRKYLGHGELQLAIKDTGYCITRNGVPADMLSEGEMTAIALLYFLKSLEDRQFDLRNGVVVLDDPVSSLDQNALFAAFGYIRARTHAAAQILILTHNFLFFRLVREWFGNLRGQDKRAWQVYMLDCAFGGTSRSARLAIDPLLMDFDSEYHYLFARLHSMATDPPATSLEAYYCAPSIARRVVETFLAFRVPDLVGHGRLWSQMLTVQFDDAKRSRIYRYVQTHSHRDAVGDADEDLTLLGESRAVLDDVLSFMRAADADHVSRMIARVTGADGGDGT